jgi:hypothetical protein
MITLQFSVMPLVYPQTHVVLTAKLNLSSQGINVKCSDNIQGPAIATWAISFSDWSYIRELQRRRRSMSSLSPEKIHPNIPIVNLTYYASIIIIRGFSYGSTPISYVLIYLVTMHARPPSMHLDAHSHYY